MYMILQPMHVVGAAMEGINGMFVFKVLQDPIVKKKSYLQELRG
jgi:hypothetical protein